MNEQDTKIAIENNRQEKYVADRDWRDVEMEETRIVLMSGNWCSSGLEITVEKNMSSI